MSCWKQATVETDGHWGWEKDHQSKDCWKRKFLCGVTTRESSSMSCSSLAKLLTMGLSKVIKKKRSESTKSTPSSTRRTRDHTYFGDLIKTGGAWLGNLHLLTVKQWFWSLQFTRIRTSFNYITKILQGKEAFSNIMHIIGRSFITVRSTECRNLNSIIP